MNRPTVFQIYYDSEQTPSLDAAFIPYSNQVNERPEWAEYWIFQKEFKNLNFTSNSHIGFVSWKFGEKCHIPGASFLRFITENPGYDVYFVNPYPHEAFAYYNIWAHGEYHHPLLLRLAQSIFNKVHPGVVLKTIDTPPDITAFCNYWCGNKDFWNAYMNFSEPIFKYIEEKLTPKQRKQIRKNADPTRNISYHPFIMERVFSTFLAINPQFKSLQLTVPKESFAALYSNSPEHYEKLKEFYYSTRELIHARKFYACSANYNELMVFKAFRPDGEFKPLCLYLLVLRLRRFLKSRLPILYWPLAAIFKSVAAMRRKQLARHPAAP